MPEQDAKHSSKEAQLVLTHDLRRLLLEGKATTQEEMRSALQALGHVVTQSKISRLLRKIGAVKSKNEKGEIVYRLPREPAPPTSASQVSSLVIDVVANETTIIVHTHPGSAQLISRIIDYHKNSIQILGSVAGDDAVFIVPKSVKKINDSLAAIKRLLSLSTP